MHVKLLRLVGRSQVVLLTMLLCCWAVSARGAELRLSAPSVEPGQEMAVPVTLSVGSGEQVASFQMDVTFNRDVLHFEGGSTGSVAESAGKTLQASERAPGRVRVLVLGFNLNTMEAGAVGSLRFSVLPGADPGQSTPLMLTGTVASDPDGNNVELSGVGTEANIGGQAQSDNTQTGKRDSATAALAGSFLASLAGNQSAMPLSAPTFSQSASASLPPAASESTAKNKEAGKNPVLPQVVQSNDISSARSPVASSIASFTQSMANLGISAGRIIPVIPSDKTLSIGDRVQLQAKAVFDDGSELSLTAAAQWESSQPDVGRIEAGGVFVATGVGVTEITPLLNGSRGSSAVLEVKNSQSTTSPRIAKGKQSADRKVLVARNSEPAGPNKEAEAASKVGQTDRQPAHSESRFAETPKRKTDALLLVIIIGLAVITAAFVVVRRHRT